MTLLAASPRPSTLPQRMVAEWNAFAIRWNPVGVIVAAWAVLTLPLVVFRGFNSDEGLLVSIARSALEDGKWWVPHVFNLRWVERPTLLSWIIAAVSWPFGHVSQISARVPMALFVLAGALLIYVLLRKVAASVPAALLGAGLFLACPLVIRSYVAIVADVPLAVLLFLAFVLWWGGCEKGSVSLRRWTAVGAVLAAAGLLKGPQPIAYFGLGIGLFILGSRSWRQIPGFVMAGAICATPLTIWYASVYTPGDAANWEAFMRMRPGAALSGPLAVIGKVAIDTLPAGLLAAAFLLAQGFRGKPLRPTFVAALACYAFVAPVFILFWPGGSMPRYYLPMLLPLCVFGGLGYDYLSAWRPQIVTLVLTITAALLLYALAVSAASPFMPMLYRQAAIDGARVAALVRTRPATIYQTGDAALDILPYVPGRIRNASLDELTALPGPAWLVLPRDQAETLLSRRTGKLHAMMLVGDKQQWRLLWLDQ